MQISYEFKLDTQICHIDQNKAARYESDLLFYTSLYYLLVVGRYRR